MADEVEAGNWLAGFLGSVGAALGVGSMNRMSKVRDQCNEHDVKIDLLEKRADKQSETLTEARDVSLENRAMLGNLEKTTERIETTLTDFLKDR